MLGLAFDSPHEAKSKGNDDEAVPIPIFFRKSRRVVFILFSLPLVCDPPWSGD